MGEAQRGDSILGITLLRGEEKERGIGFLPTNYGKQLQLWLKCPLPRGVLYEHFMQSICGGGERWYSYTPFI